MNPVPIQKGVEIIVGLQTGDRALKEALALCEKMGKIPSTSKDTPGFLANRILMPYINEAIICLETGVGEKEGMLLILSLFFSPPLLLQKELHFIYHKIREKEKT